MSSKIKKVIAVFLTLMMLGSLTACGGSGDSGASVLTSEADTSNSSTADDEYAEEVDLSFVLLTDGIAYPNDSLMEENLAAVAKEKLNVNLTVRRVNFGDMSTSLSLWLTSGAVSYTHLEWFGFSLAQHLLKFQPAFQFE